MDDDDLCMHLLPPAQCTTCLDKGDRRITRAQSTVTKYRNFVCAVCQRDRPEEKFPTYNGVRKPTTCRECVLAIRQAKKDGVTKEEVVARRRREFSRPSSAE